MREEFAPDHLVTPDVDPADVGQMVPHPGKKEKRKAIEKLKKEPDGLKADDADKAFANEEKQRPTMRGFNIANPGMKKQILRPWTETMMEGRAFLQRVIP